MSAPYRTCSYACQYVRIVSPQLSVTWNVHAGTHMGKVLIQVSASEEARVAAQAGAPPDKPFILPRTNLAEEYLPREEPKPAAQGGESASKEAGSKAEAEAVSRRKVGDCHGLHVLRLVRNGRG